MILKKETTTTRLIKIDGALLKN